MASAFILFKKTSKQSDSTQTNMEPNAPTYQDLQKELDAMRETPALPKSSPSLPKSLPRLPKLKSKSSSKMDQVSLAAAFKAKKDLLLSIKGLLKRCDVCLETKLSDEWYKCSPGQEVFQWHFICPRCQREGRSCDELHKEKHEEIKMVLIQKDSTETFAQRILKQLPKSCKYDTLGCEEILYENSMTLHEKNCRYRPIYCVHLACTAKVSYADYLKHFEQKHLNGQKMTIQDEKFVLKFELSNFKEAPQYLPARIMAFGKTFFEVGIIKDQVMFRWVYFYGFPDEAENFYYRFSIKKEDSDEELTYLGQAHPLVKHYSDIIEDYDAFFAPVKKIEKFLDSDANLKFDVKILRKQDLKEKKM